MSALSRNPSAEDVQRLLSLPGQLTSALQPIVDIHAMVIAGYEGLCRFPTSPFAPLAWFSAARRAGLGPILESRACAAALHRLPDIPSHRFLSINLSPEALMVAGVRAQLHAVDPARLLLELTEDIDTPDLLLQATHLAALRRDGVRLAVDDIGAGYSSLARVLRLGADFLKIDRELVSGCASDPLKRYVLEVLVTLARKQGGDVIAEGVEEMGDLRVVHDVGIRYVQGYLLGRPQADPAELTRHHHDRLQTLTTRDVIRLEVEEPIAGR